MEIETNNILGSMSESIERLSATAAQLEKTALLIEQREAERHGDLQKIVATAIEPGVEVSAREQDLERRLAAAEKQLTELRAQEEKPASLRKTLPAATVQLLAKGGITALESIEAGALDAALTGLSLEQRIAVKSQLLRAGAIA
jgi:hypothetical protein